MLLLVFGNRLQNPQYSIHWITAPSGAFMIVCRLDATAIVGDEIAKCKQERTGVRKTLAIGCSRKCGESPSASPVLLCQARVRNPICARGNGVETMRDALSCPLAIYLIDRAFGGRLYFHSVYSRKFRSHFTLASSGMQRIQSAYTLSPSSN